MLPGPKSIGACVAVLALLVPMASFFGIPPSVASRSLHFAPATETPIRTTTPTEERGRSGIVIPTSIAIPPYPGEMPTLTRPAPLPSLTTASVAPDATQQTYVVEPGDSFYRIAQKLYGNGAKYPYILRANNLNENARLYPGMILIIPSIAGAAEPVSTKTQTAPLIAAPNQSPTIGTPNLVSPVATTRTSGAATLSPTTTAQTITSTVFTGVASRNPTTLPVTQVPISGSSFLATSSVDARTTLRLLINVVSAILVGASVVCGILAYMVHQRARQLERRHRMVLRVRPPVVYHDDGAGVKRMIYPPPE